MASERYERLWASYDKYATEGTPTLIVAQALLKDTKNDNIVAQLKFQNIDSRYIQAVNIELKAFDSFGKELQGIPEYQYTDLHVKTGDFWGADRAIILPNNLTRTINVAIKSIIFSDNTIWESNQSEWYKLKTQDNLFSALKNEELVKQFRLEYGSWANYMYLEDDAVWHCICGTINPDKSNKCYGCKTSREKLIFFDYEALKDNKDKRVAVEKAQAEERERIAKEEAEAQAQRIAQAEAERIEKENQAKEKKQKSIKRILTCMFWIIDIGVIFAGICYLVIHLLIPFIKYNDASELQAEESYVEAIEIYEELGGYSDSSKKILQCKYAYATSLKEQKQYSVARDIFSELGDYSDAQQQVKECIYYEALIAAEQGHYEQAYNMLSSIKDYSDSAEQIDKMKYGRVWEARDSGNYEKAIALLEKMPGEKELIKEYKLLWGKQLMDEGKYSEAIDVFDTMSKVHEAILLKSEAKFLYGKQCYEEGDYLGAKKLFDVAKYLYPDAEEWYKKAVYACANEYFEKGDYVNATSNYSVIKDYEDSEEKYLEANYLYALQLIKDKKYVDALNRFSVSPTYKDSENKVKEVKYAYVTSHKDNQNSTTYRYLKDLVNIGYSNASEIYDDLYEWKAKIVFNSSENDSKTNKSKISKWDTVYAHVILSGGTPNGSTKIKTVIT